MDHEGMDLLRYPGENGALAKWEAYLSRTKVSLLLAVEVRGGGADGGRIRFVGGIRFRYWWG